MKLKQISLMCVLLCNITISYLHGQSNSDQNSNMPQSAKKVEEISNLILDLELPTSKNNFHIFLLMGQSNMAGYGDLIDGDEKEVPGVLMLDGQCSVDGKQSSDDFRWRKAAHRLHILQPTARFGLGIDFAKKYRESHPEVTVGLIPCAWGGAAIDSLKKGTPSYINAVKRANFASKNGTISGVLWHQGESDSVNAQLAQSYESKLHTLILDLRTDLCLPQLPFIAGELAPFYLPNRTLAQQPHILLVQKTLQSLPQQIPFTDCVKMNGLASYGDNVHFDRASYIIMGQRYAESMSKTLRQNQK